MNQNQYIRWLLKPAIFTVSLLPLVWLVNLAINDSLGANPIETINRYTGDWTLRFLLLTLAVTPLRRLTGWHALIRFRRMLGLFAFFYVCVHFLSFVWLDQAFQLDDIIKDVIKRPFITVGFMSFLLLIPLAATSTQGMVRRLGGKRWQQLHRLVYAVGIGGVVHFLWLVKSDLTQPLIYGALLSLLLGFRLLDKARRFPGIPPFARPRKREGKGPAVDPAV
ncbi:MAG: protein-methionine-sulfoxide reductase heme-binding subunit MsrQ [Gammaproteobacteria bacterium]|nr:MAG: protein-methionine-sulfoxide reductase heme-binding subunit MsrQ [Gammaproteobacteria bacterium]